MPIRKIVECIPNVSEAGNVSIVEELKASIASVPLVRLLDSSSDPDHNRTVFTFIGPPEAVRSAAYRMTERAVKLIDIEKHEGVHPFIGAVDVIPFVPLHGIGREETVEMARSLGDEIAHNLRLPVYFYGYASLRHDRTELPEVRRGGYRKLKEDIGLPSRHPDYGEPKLSERGGAVAIGVRDFLVAFNVNLDSNDLEAAREIARSVREKHGGLAGVRALGVPLTSRGIVQISINLTDHRETTLKEVMDFVRKRTDEKGIEIKGGEIIGLIPKDAIFPNMAQYLKLDHFDGRKVINNYL